MAAGAFAILFWSKAMHAKRGIIMVILAGLLMFTLGPSNVNFGGVDSPPGFGFVITPSDSVNLTTVTRAIFVGTGGDVQVRYAGNDADIVLKNVPSGSRVSGRFSRIKATSTTATNIVGEY